jgi:protein-L-isoaspartate(D-aspartate) O-methyltransferase
MSWAIWITGLPGSGKSAIARAAAAELHSRGQDVAVLELDEIRRVITPAPTYSDAEREAVYRALVHIGATLVDAGIPVIFDATAHRRAWRDLARATLRCFAEVQLVCPLAVCQAREATRPRGAAPPGIYAGAMRPGARVPGVNVEYEPALAPELEVDTAVHGVAEAAAVVAAFVERSFISQAQAVAKTTDAPRRTLLLEDGSPEQKAISRRAHAHALRLLKEWRARPTSADFAAERDRMVEVQIAGRGVRDPAILAAMRKVPRHAFVPAHLARSAYEDGPLPIGEDQTISQPYIVAAMIAAVRPESHERALEIGTGSGYSAAVLASIVAEVYTIERLAGLAAAARQRLAELGYRNVHVREANGTLGWPDHAPYDVIIVTAGGPTVPSSLLEQLTVGGRLVMPVGSWRLGQRLMRVVRTGANDYHHTELEDVVFVPLIGKEGWQPGDLQE